MTRDNGNNDFFSRDHDFQNFTSIHNATDSDANDTEDYDFDYDPNEMYFALNGKD